MTMMLALTNVADLATAHRIAEALVTERLAACVNVLGACRSVYRWQGAIERADEVPLLIKTTADAWPALARRLRALHPYEVPEIVAWQPSEVGDDYLAWAVGETTGASAGGSEPASDNESTGDNELTAQASRSQRAASSAK